MIKTRGRPKFSGNQFICLKDLINRFPPNACVPLASSFIKKYKLLDEKIENAINTPILPVEHSGVQLKIMNFTKEDEI